jgi:hypothetical protein
MYGAVLWLVLHHTTDRPHSDLTFFARNTSALDPEPREQLAYLVLLSAPIVLVVLTVLLTRLRPSIACSRWVVRAAVAGEVMVMLLVLASIAAQLRIGRYFTVPALGLGMVIGILTLAVVVASPGRLRQVRLPRVVSARSRRASRIALGVAAVLALCVCSGLYTIHNLRFAPEEASFHIPFSSEEFSSVLNGATPLVDFTPQYSFVLPYVLEPVFDLQGGLTVTTFSVTMVAFSWLGLLAVYGAFRVATGRPLQALLTFAAFVGLALYPTSVDHGLTMSSASYYADLPLRYGLPFALTLLLVKTVPSLDPRLVFCLGLGAGATVMNNLDFGLPALGATVIALWCAARTRGRLPLRELTLLMLGLGVVVLGVVAVALARSGSVPDFEQMLYYPRQFALAGFLMKPIPGPFGLYLVMFLTLAGGLVLALLLAEGGSADEGEAVRLALLAYSSTFGLGVGSYFVGRSEYHVLAAIFAAWALCLAAASAVIIPHLGRLVRASLALRLAAAPALALTAASLTVGIASLPAQAGALDLHDKLRNGPSLYANGPMRALMQRCAPNGANAAVVYPFGYQLANAANVRDWFPYASERDVVTYQQLDSVRSSLASRHVTWVFTSSVSLAPEVRQMLIMSQWQLVTSVSSHNDRLEAWSRAPDGSPASAAMTRTCAHHG